MLNRAKEESSKYFASKKQKVRVQPRIKRRKWGDHGSSQCLVDCIIEYLDQLWVPSIFRYFPSDSIKYCYSIIDRNWTIPLSTNTAGNKNTADQFSNVAPNALAIGKCCKLQTA